MEGEEGVGDVGRELDGVGGEEKESGSAMLRSRRRLGEAGIPSNSLVQFTGLVNCKQFWADKGIDHTFSLLRTAKVL